MDELAQHLRYALRALRRSPGFTLVAVLTLALGIGANTAIFSAVDAVLLRPLPYAAPDRLVRVANHWEGEERANLSPAEFLDYAARLHSFSGIGAYAGGSANLTGAGGAEAVPAGYLTAALLPTLGVQPARGRLFAPGEDRPGAANVVILTDGLWRRRYGAAPDILGRTILVDGDPATVIGVLPAGFRLPSDFGVADPAELFQPLTLDPAATQNRGSHFLNAVARLKPGVPLERADAELRGLAAEFVRAYPGDYPADMHFGAGALPLREDVLGGVRPALLVLLGAVGLVLLIACANVANLMLARAEGRRRELAVRAAIGASRGHLARQLLVESLVLALAGGALGVLLATWGSRALVALRPPDIPRLEGVALDARVLGVALLASILTGVLFGLAPLALLRGRDRFAALREGARGGSAGVGSRRFRDALVVAEIALALVLLAGATLLVRTVVALYRVDPGYRTERLLTFRLEPPASAYPEASQVVAFYPRLLERLRSLPGVQAAGAVSNLPLESSLGDLNFRIEGRAVPAGGVSPRADWQVVTPGYLEAMGIRLVRGRGIEPSDAATSPGVVVLSEAVAKTYWPGQDPIGRRMELGGGAGPGWVTVIGIARDVRHASLDAAPKPTMYLAHTQFRFWNGGSVRRGMTVTLRTAGDPAALAAAARREVKGLDPNLPVSDLRTIEQVVASSVARPRFFTALLGGFAALALALAAIGIYGVMAYLVRRRRREVGIRMALGARGLDVARLVVGEGARRAAFGVALGVIASLALTRFLAGLLYGVRPTDPLTLAAVALAVAGVAVLACALPAREAARVQPRVAMEEE